MAAVSGQIPMTGFDAVAMHRSSALDQRGSYMKIGGFSICGLNHLGLVVSNIDIAREWFHGTLGLEILEDRGELIFFKAGKDIIAAKTPRLAVAKPEHGGEPDTEFEDFASWQHLDHYGFYAKSESEVDAFAAMLREQNIDIIKGPYSRSDGRSVYFRDPCGLVGEYLWMKAL